MNLRVLQIEDSESDAALIARALRLAGLSVEFVRASTAETMRDALDRHKRGDSHLDAILCDFRLPGFDADQALGIVRQSALDIPFIVVSGVLGEDAAVSMMRAGAQDYVTKSNLARLAPALEREVREAQTRAGRGETERLLKEHQDRLTLAMEATQFGTFEYFFGEGSVVWSGIPAAHAGEVPREPAPVEYFFRMMHPVDRLRVLRTGRQTMLDRDEGQLLYEFRADPKIALLPGKPVRAADREWRWYSVWAKLFFGPDGNPIRVLGVAREITQRKREEAEQRYNADLTRAITQQTADSIFVTDAQGRVTYLNDEAQRVFGYSAAEAAGMVLHDLIHGGGTTTSGGRGESCGLGRMIRAGETFRDFEDLLARRDGTRISASCSGRALTVGGQTIGTVLTVRDITARKQAEAELRESEARFQRLIGAGIIGIIIADREKILEANDYYLKLIGLTREKFQELKLNWTDFTPPEYAPMTQKLVEAVVREGFAAPIEKEYVRPDGSRIPVLIGGVMIPYRGHKCFLGFALDHTVHRSMEEQIRHAQKMESLGVLAGGIAHDFNNLLTIILGYSQLLGGALPEGDLTHERIDRIVRAAEQAAGLTRQLLTFSRQDRGAPTVLDLNVLLHDIESMLRGVMGERVELSLQYSDSPLPVRADGGQLEQAIVNLALNARDALPEGGHFWLETRLITVEPGFEAECFAIEPGRFVQLTASDDGVGMTPEVQARVFEPFFTTKVRGKGTGLGLSMVYGTVKRWGGNIRLHSSPGLGTTLRIFLPAEQSSNIASPCTTAHAPAGTGTLLVVEDQDGVRTYVCDVLRSAGYTVLAADGLKSATEIAETNPGLDLLITDFVLPGATGLDVIAAVRAHIPGAPALIISGYAEQLGPGDPATPFLQKPFSSNDLLTRVEQLTRATANPESRINRNSI